MSFAIKNLDHVVVRVADLDRAVRFYCDVLDCCEERRVASINLVQLRAGASMIDLILAEPPPTDAGRNMDHLALRIEPFDESELRRHLEHYGVQPGEVVTRYGAEGNGPSMYIEDPDGNSIELKGPPQP